MNDSHQHLALSTIQQYLDEALQTSDLRYVEEHLRSCSQCADMLEITRQVHDLAAQTRKIEPSANLLKMAAKAATGALARGTDNLQKFLPQVADSRFSPASAGVRGTTQNRHLLYSDGDSLVDLEIERSEASPELYTIRGQISIPKEADLTGIEVQLLKDEGIVRRCITDQVGQFRLSGLQHDSYRLLFGQRACDILIENIEF